METIYVIFLVLSVPLLILLFATVYYLYKKYWLNTEEYEEITFPEVTFSNLISFDATDNYSGSDYSLIS
jgi:hypothetical protein